MERKQTTINFSEKHNEDMQKRAADHAMKTVLPYILLIVALLAGTLIAIVLAWLLF